MRLENRRGFLKRMGTLATATLGINPAAAIPLTRTCEQNLHAIHDAVMVYHRTRGRLPDSLTELVILGLIDPALLICPVHQTNGTNRPDDPSQASNLQDDPLTLYNWEFGGRKDKKKNFLLRELHERQMKIGLGGWVAMVRCDQHDNGKGDSHLNLAINGGIFASGMHWEYRVRHLIPFPYLYAKAIINKDPVVPLWERIPARLPSTGSQQLDLGPAFNGAFTDPWPEGYEGEEAPEILQLGGGSGVWGIEGIDFEMRGVVQLEGHGAAKAHPESSEPRFPFVSRMIPAGMESETLHVLCGVIRDVADGLEVAKLSLTTTTDEVVEFPLKQGIHVSHARPVPVSPSAQIVWSRPMPLPEDTGIRNFSRVTWNLGRKMKIKSLRFIAGNEANYPFLIAVTST